MQFSKGCKPNGKVDRETIRSTDEGSLSLFDGKSGVYAHQGKFYIIGEGVFLEYADLASAKQDWFGKSEEAMCAEVMQEGEPVDAIYVDDSLQFQDFFYRELYYRVQGTNPPTLSCSPVAFAEASMAMISLPALPERFSAYTFPSEMDSTTEIYFEEELFYWLMDEGEIRKTLFSSAEEGEIPQVSYIVEFDRAYFIAIPAEFAIEGRFSSLEEVLERTDYASMGEEPYEEVDYVAACLLDRVANDEEVDYIADEGLYDWMENHADYEGSYELDETDAFAIYRLFDGYFVLDPYERSVRGKYTTFDTAYDGIDEEFGDEEEDDEDDRPE